MSDPDKINSRGLSLESINIKDILLRGNFLTEVEAGQTDDYAKYHGLSFMEALLSRGILTRPLLGQALAESFGLSFIDLQNKPLNQEQVLKIPAEIAERYHVVLAQEDGVSIVIATDNPLDVGMSRIMTQLFPDKKIIFAYSFEDDIRALFARYRKSLEARFVQIIKTQKKIAPEILNQIFEEAVIYHASDIHFEPRETGTVTRFRVDGVLVEVGNIPGTYYQNILNRIKVQAGLKIDEHFSAQEGSISYINEGTVLDIRVSIVPTVNGEKVVMRLLGEYAKNLSLGDLGLSPAAFAQVVQIAGRPSGMILVTGPAGSGKTTTVYALLKNFNNAGVNITTIEDPVEYRIPSMNQIQVNSGKSLGFADGLRSVMRQDPDIILVGEIRDKATVELSINAAFTGHLLFSTFHANDAVTTVPDLLDMGAEPYLLASALKLIVAQRLVRRICESCRYSLAMQQQELTETFPSAAKYFLRTSGGQEIVTFYRGKGCGACKNTGFKGRVGIFEVIEVTKDMRDLIVRAPSAQDVWNLARKQGAKTLFEDGVEKVKSGMTTLEELIRVAPPTN